MKFTNAQIRELADSTKFPADNLEKVLRLRELLIEFHKHSFLRGKLVLKGGTALNLFYLHLARLSVDIDLNYIGHIDREATLLDRPEIIKAVERVAVGLGYRLQNGKDDYTLREWHLNFTNHAGRPDRIPVEINLREVLTQKNKLITFGVSLTGDQSSRSWRNQLTAHFQNPTSAHVGASFAKWSFASL